MAGDPVFRWFGPHIARAIHPVKIVAGEHIPNRVVFKNFIESGAMHDVSADCTRLAEVSEFLIARLLARKFHLLECHTLERWDMRSLWGYSRTSPMTTC